MKLPNCRLYLIAPNPLPTDFPARLQAALKAGDVAALRVPAVGREALAPIAAVTRAHGVALILDGPPALASACGCDGAHVSGPDAAEAARGALGDLQLGVFCGGSRDAAMRAGEAGADYVAFGPQGEATEPDSELIAWWADLMEIPCVAEGTITTANCVALARAGADFLAVGDAVWNDPAGPEAGLLGLLAAISAA